MRKVSLYNTKTVIIRYLQEPFSVEEEQVFLFPSRLALREFGPVIKIHYSSLPTNIVKILVLAHEDARLIDNSLPEIENGMSRWSMMILLQSMLSHQD